MDGSERHADRPRLPRAAPHDGRRRVHDRGHHHVHELHRFAVCRGRQLRLPDRGLRQRGLHGEQRHGQRHRHTVGAARRQPDARRAHDGAERLLHRHVRWQPAGSDADLRGRRRQRRQRHGRHGLGKRRLHRRHRARRAHGHGDRGDPDGQRHRNRDRPRGRRDVPRRRGAHRAEPQGIRAHGSHRRRRHLRQAGGLRGGRRRLRPAAVRGAGPGHRQ